MPPKPKQLRCAYVEGRQRCKRAGTGNPPLCEAHRIVLEEEAARPPRPGERLVGLLGRAFRGQKISDKHVHAGIADLVDLFQQNPNFEEPQAQAKERLREQARQWQQRQANGAPRPPPAAKKRAAELEHARIVLGFPAGQKLTVDDIKKRHRELARKHHPDHGGDVRKMAAVNHAVDLLVSAM